MLKIENLTLSYKKTTVLDGVNLSLKPHTVTALIGKNAAGKSSLLSCLTGQNRYKGKITFSGKDLALMSIRERAKLISLLPQQLPSPDITGYELVKLGRTPYLDVGRRFTEEDIEAVEKAIALVKAENIINKKITDMSGGEKQKIYLAMTLATDTRLIAFDEPTSYMDAHHEREFYNLLESTVKKQKKTALVVMHDLTRAVETADSIAVLDNGKIIFHDDTEKVKQSGIIQEVFGVKAYEVEGMTVYR